MAGKSKSWFEYKNPVTKVVYKVSSVKEGAKIAKVQQPFLNMYTRNSRPRSAR